MVTRAPSVGDGRGPESTAIVEEGNEGSSLPSTGVEGMDVEPTPPSSKRRARIPSWNDRLTPRLRKPPKQARRPRAERDRQGAAAGVSRGAPAAEQRVIGGRRRRAAAGHDWVLAAAPWPCGVGYRCRCVWCAGSSSRAVRRMQAGWGTLRPFSIIPGWGRPLSTNPRTRGDNADGHKTRKKENLKRMCAKTTMDEFESPPERKLRNRPGPTEGSVLSAARSSAMRRVRPSSDVGYKMEGRIEPSRNSQIPVPAPDIRRRRRGRVLPANVPRTPRASRCCRAKWRAEKPPGTASKKAYARRGPRRRPRSSVGSRAASPSIWAAARGLPAPALQVDVRPCATQAR